MPKRYRSRSRVDFSRAVKTAKRTGTMSSVSKARRARSYYKLRPTTVAQRVSNLYRMIETKEITWKAESSGSGAERLFFPHNALTVFAMNPFQVSQGAGDAMQEGNQINRIGDRITVKGMMIRGFFENALERSKVHYRIMLVRCAKGDTPTRATFYKGNCNNKMIDQANTERYSIIAQKYLNISASNSGAATSASAAGVPLTGPTNTTWNGGQGTKAFSMWIPGRKFGPGGNIQYENNSYQVKFYDYKLVVMAYDWYGTPQDANNVGFCNCVYTKVYFKDA